MEVHVSAKGNLEPAAKKRKLYHNDEQAPAVAVAEKGAITATDEHKTPKKRNGRRLCSVAECQNFAQKGGICVKHGATQTRKNCSREGCTSYAVQGGVCIAHGAKSVHPKCSREGCSNTVVNGGVCVSHGAKRKMCPCEGCTNQAWRGGVCKGHGAKGGKSNQKTDASEIRNKDSSMIDTDGFVEVSETLPRSLMCDMQQKAEKKAAQYNNADPESRKRKRGVREISNALEVDVPKGFKDQIENEVKSCTKVNETMQEVFGKEGGGGESKYAGFEVKTPKVIVSEPGSKPQLPHADDHCSTCLFCIVHLKDNQESTRIAPYKSKKYPTDVYEKCENCGCKKQLPDSDFRRGIHLTNEKWHCNDCDLPTCDDFDAGIVESFGELSDKKAPQLCNSYAGSKTQNSGDGVLCLPMLIHCGPGNSTEESRCVLFFTLKPIYKDTVPKKVKENVQQYEDDLQIHASCVLDCQRKKHEHIYGGLPNKEHIK